MKQGSLFIALSAFLWGLFPILTSKVGTSLDPLWNSTLSTAISIIPFAILLTFSKRWYELTNKRALIYSLLSATLIGVVYYSLVFIGSSLTSPQNTAILLLLELVTSLIFLAPFREERLHLNEIIGSVVLLGSALLVVGGKMTAFTRGDWILIGGSVLTPFGNLFAKKARLEISTETLLFIRSTWSSICLLIVSYCFAGQFPQDMTTHDILILSTTGILLMGLSKILWTEGFVRLKITSSLAIYCAVTPCTTFVFAYMLYNQVPTFYQLIALPVGIMGAGILLKGFKPPTAPAGQF